MRREVPRAFSRSAAANTSASETEERFARELVRFWRRRGNVCAEKAFPSRSASTRARARRDLSTPARRFRKKPIRPGADKSEQLDCAVAKRRPAAIAFRAERADRGAAGAESGPPAPARQHC